MMRRNWLWVLLLFFAVGCGATPIRHYQVGALTEQIEGTEAKAKGPILAVRSFGCDAAYDDRRIVYRESDVRLDYYHFHRWAAEPGRLVSEVLREVYRQSGYFEAVVSGFAVESDLVLDGRVVALEEVDVDDTHWKARVVLELMLRDENSGDLVWSDLVSTTERLEERNPAHLARAVSAALTRLGSETAPTIAGYGLRVRKPARAQAKKQ